jgi:hypothetical protein
LFQICIKINNSYNPYSKFITVLIAQTQSFPQLRMVKTLYTVLIKIDETLPWIELKRTYSTRKDARKAAEDFRNSMQMKIVSMPEGIKPLKAVVPLRIRH